MMTVLRSGMLAFAVSALVAAAPVGYALADGGGHVKETIKHAKEGVEHEKEASPASGRVGQGQQRSACEEAGACEGSSNMREESGACGTGFEPQRESKGQVTIVSKGEVSPIRRSPWNRAGVLPLRELTGSAS